MKKSKEKRSEISLLSSKSDVQVKEEVYIPPLDVFMVKILGLQVADEECRHYAIKVTYFDQLIVSSILKSVSSRSPLPNYALAIGTMNYDPSDYEKMCLFADCPLVVNIQPLKSIETNLSQGRISSDEFGSDIQILTDIFCCNIDVLPVFLGQDKLKLRKRMEPMVDPPLLRRQSWDNLPLLTIEVTVARHPENAHHHKILKTANWMKISLVGAFNMQIPFSDEFVFTAATKNILYNEANTGLVTYNQGNKMSKGLNYLSFYPNWENLRIGDNFLTKGDEKFVCKMDDIQNSDNLDLKYYMSESQRMNTITWGSFHRTLMLGNSCNWLAVHLRENAWPFEVHMYGDSCGLSFMAFLNLFHLLYPGEKIVRIAVPLHWIDAQKMQETCGCDLLLTPNNNMCSPSSSTPKPKLPTDSGPTSVSTEMALELRPTGADENCSFILVEVELARPLKEIVIPTPITCVEIKAMLRDMEQSAVKRECTGRGYSDQDWMSTLRTTEGALRKVPQYGLMEFCAFNRQLSETRTRVKILTSFWMDAAIFVNNNFVVQDFLTSDEVFEEMLMMSHACMLRTACHTLLGGGDKLQIDPTLRAARHARQMQDIPHATELYLQLVVQKPHGANEWRELSTCLQDVDRDWASVCLNKAVLLDIRHPLTLLSKGCLLFEEDPEAAEPFFDALLALNPFWSAGWVAVSAYYWKRELFHMADQVMECMKKCQAEGLAEDLDVPRAWERELGDWWDPAPLLPGMSPYYSAADLLLRLRAITLAEVCLSRAIAETGESAASLHLVAVCCRLRGDIDEALCHLRLAIDKFGDINYIRGLQGECYHQNKDTQSAIASFVKAGSCLSAYSILLSLSSCEAQRARNTLLDLVRRQPSAYAWLAIADDWMQRASSGEGPSDEQTAARTCAAAYAVQALKYDRQAPRAWALLARLVTPSARRLHCKQMAEACGYEFTEERRETKSQSKQSLCHVLGRALRECHCFMCKHLKL